MTTKTRSIELESGLIVNFLKGGIEVVDKTAKVLINDDELETIRATVKSNARGNAETQRETQKSNQSHEQTSK